MLTKDFIEIEADSREEVLNEILNDQNSELFYKKPSIKERSAKMNNTIMVSRTSETEEQKILYAILDALKIDDIVIRYRNKNLYAKDSYGNVWKGSDFYRFLINEAIVWEDEENYANQNGFGKHALGIKNSLLADFKTLCKNQNIIF